MNEEEKVVTVENAGDKGNPNHVPAGDPSGKGGQFTSADGTSGGGSPDSNFEEKENFTISLEEEEPAPVGNPAFKAALARFIEKKQAPLNEEANKLVSDLKEQLPEVQQELINTLDRNEKIGLLSKSPLGYDTKRIKYATDAQIDALLMSEAVLNWRPSLEDELERLEQEKDTINEQIQDELHSYDIDTLYNVWKDKTVYPHDFKDLFESGSYDKKVEYFQGLLDDPNQPVGAKAMATQRLAQLASFKEAGEAYEKAKAEVSLKFLDQLEENEMKSNEIRQKLEQYDEDNPAFQMAKDYTAKFQDANSAYSKARKDNAVWFNSSSSNKNMQDALAFFGPRAKKMWASMTQDERDELDEYTSGSSRYNEPLRKKSYSGGKKYAGNITPSGVNFRNAIDNLTNAIDKCTWEEDIWVQRGVDADTDMFELVGKSGKFAINQMTESEMQSMVGQTFKDNGFYSAGAGKHTGFAASSLIINTYCPKGTKMVYMNIAGHFAHSNENEMILQRGYRYRITKVEKKGFQYYVDCEVILGSDDDKAVGEDLEKIGTIYNY